MTPTERRLRNLAIVAVCCIAWALLIALCGGVVALIERIG